MMSGRQRVDTRGQCPTKDLKALSCSVPPSDASVHKAASIPLVIHQGVGTPINTVLRDMTGIVTRIQQSGVSAAYHISLYSHIVTLDIRHGHKVTGNLALWSCGHRL